MTNNDIVEPAMTEGLRFFGRISAVISHDLKNTLSIMNESAGLLEDLSLLAEKGRPLDHRRIQQLGAAIKGQVLRNDRIVRHMNRFAHSVDDPVKEIALTASLEMLLAICRRLTDARGVTVTVVPCGPDTTLVTRPFHFYHLVWLLLEWGMDYTGPSKRMDIRIEPEAAWVHLIFQGLDALTPDAQEEPPPRLWRALLALLGGSLEITAARQSISTLLPKRIEA